MFNLLKNLTKAAVAVAVTPVDAVVDVLNLPSDAYGPGAAFPRVTKRLGQAGDAIDEAVKPEKE